MNTQPDPNRREFDRREEVFRLPFVSGCNAAAVLSPIEEPFNQVAIPIQIRPEANWISPIATRRIVRPGARENIEGLIASES